MDIKLVDLYRDALQEDGRDMIRFEIADSERLIRLYEKRLKCLRDRDPALALVSEGAVELYDQYEQHFIAKLKKLRDTIDAATFVLNNT